MTIRFPLTDPPALSGLGIWHMVQPIVGSLGRGNDRWPLKLQL